MREIDTDALSAVAESLGIANPATATRPVTFDDDNLQQTFQVDGHVVEARASAVAPRGGLFSIDFAFSNETAGTTVTNLSWNPWLFANPINGLSLGDSEPWKRFDLWFVSESVPIMEANATHLKVANIFQSATPTSGLPGWSFDNDAAGAALTPGVSRMIFNIWTPDDGFGSADTIGITRDGLGDFWSHHRYRFPSTKDRPANNNTGSRMHFRYRSTAGTDNRCHWSSLWALAPRGMSPALT